MMAEAEVGAVVLAGGQSRRMGTNKALLVLHQNGPHLISIALSAVESLARQVVISANEPVLYQDLGWPVVCDNYPGQGPLAGLEAGLNALDMPVTIVVACDMPYVKSALLTYLLAQAAGYQAVVPLNQEGRPEPLCAVYRQDCLRSLRASLECGILKMTDWLNQIEVCYVPASELLPFDPALSSFRNLNTLQDVVESLEHEFRVDNENL